MNRGLGAGVVLAAISCAVGVGCQVKRFYTPPPETIPAPTEANGVRVTIEDARPDQDRQPFTGPVCLYHPGRIKPSPWDQLVEQTRAVVADMPDKPERVDVAVTAFRLVQKEDTGRKHQPGPSVANPVRPDKPDPATAGQNNAPAGSDTGPGKGTFLWGFLEAHPVGASCAVRATVRFVYADGREQTVEVDRMAAGQNLTGTKYLGDAIEESARGAVRLYGQQLRQGLGLPPGN